MKQKKMIILISILLVIIAIQFAMLVSTQRAVNLMDDEVDRLINTAVGYLKRAKECLSSEQTVESMYSVATDLHLIQSDMNLLSYYYGNIYNGSYNKTQELGVAVSKVIGDIYWYAAYDLPARYSSKEPLAPIDVKKVELSRSMIEIIYTVMDRYDVPYGANDDTHDHFSLKSLGEIYTQICAGIEEHFSAEYEVLLDMDSLPAIFEYIS